jgi:small subunit ribosomal protein S17
MAKKTYTGELTSQLGRSVCVSVETQFRHPRYSKIIKKKKKYLADNEFSGTKPGDLVEIVEVRPISSRKKWKVVKVINK